MKFFKSNLAICTLIISIFFIVGLVGFSITLTISTNNFKNAFKIAIENYYQESIEIIEIYDVNNTSNYEIFVKYKKVDGQIEGALYIVDQDQLLINTNNYYNITPTSDVYFGAEGNKAEKFANIFIVSGFFFIFLIIIYCVSLKNRKAEKKKGEVHVSISKPAIDYSKISYSELEKMADNSDPKAQYELGSGYFYGEYKNQQRYVKSYTHAEAWLTKAAQQRHPDAQLMLAFIAYKKNEIEKATKWYLRAAENGSNLAKLHLAALYYNEEIQIEDPIIILNYLFDITNSNLINAKKLMGHYYERGLLVGKDKNKALEWYLKAYSALPYSSESNKLDKNELSELNFNIGNLYYDDEINLKNYSKALFHLKLALENKESKYYLDVSFLIGEFHFLGKINGVPDYKEAYLNYQNVVDFKVNSINSNFKKTIARAQSRLSEMYKKGLYVYLDEKEALRWYELSLETQKNIDLENNRK